MNANLREPRAKIAYSHELPNSGLTFVSQVFLISVLRVRFAFIRVNPRLNL